MLLVLGAHMLCSCGDAGSLPDGSTIVDAPSSSVQTGFVIGSSLNSGLELAVVCVPDRGDVRCVRDHDDGSYAIVVPFLPANVDISVQASRPGFLSLAVPVHETVELTVWPSTLALLDDARAIVLLDQQAGFEYLHPTGTGFVRARVVDPEGRGVSGATVTLMPATGKGPVYLDDDGKPDPALVSTSSSGVALFGNVTPQPFSIVVDAGARRCVGGSGTDPHLGWPAEPPAVIAGAAFPDTLTDGLSVICD